jgi:hypothetical protein
LSHHDLCLAERSSPNAAESGSAKSSIGESGSSLLCLRTLCARTWRETWRRQSCDGRGAPEQAQLQSLPHRGQAISVEGPWKAEPLCAPYNRHAKFSDSDEFPPQCSC